MVVSMFHWTLSIPCGMFYTYARFRNFRFYIGRDKMGFTILVCADDAAEPAFKYPCVSHTSDVGKRLM